MTSARSKWIFGGTAGLVFAFLYLPLALIALYAFNKTTVNAWPFPGFSTRWFTKLWHDPEPKDAAWLSVQIAFFSTCVALALGTALAFAFARFHFFGREAVNFAVTLPIILPGVITGVALASFFLFTGTELSLRTVVIGHTTFCIVLVFNNVLARLRRLPLSYAEASRDLGATGLQTFRFVTLPSIRTALVAGALLSFALSFDEIAVTFFLAGADTTTLPLWILGAFRNSRSLPEVNAVATCILIISLPMIATAAYLMRDEGAAGRIVEK
ncbi:MAG: ABC transporter permease [Thermoleophilaceae bacterium]|nr:ABC transporter permease [Thermoleophilaceae bacterium]